MLIILAVGFGEFNPELARRQIGKEAANGYQ